MKPLRWATAQRYRCNLRGIRGWATALAAGAAVTLDAEAPDARGEEEGDQGDDEKEDHLTAAQVAAQSLDGDGGGDGDGHQVGDYQAQPGGIDGGGVTPRIH